jgi:hypothetical protein
VLPDHTTAPVQVAYNNVQQMGPNMSKGSKIALWVTIAAVATLVIVVLAIRAEIASN